ncbi:hypothetical protein QSV37_18575 [Acinetobacter sp. VNK23]|uniref:hypothetical protein n=1 Tax=Acinetobacter thutiue TaxID=2998078 RepID=UPI0025768132|nr:hypothetical protein [Acinetobacter thutiue]MDM1022269.1 hypothetical protein [Acinetobacter thutiue]
MKDDYLFLDYLWDLQPNYFDIKNIESDISFNRKALCLDEVDDCFIKHVSDGNIFIDKPISEKRLFIGLTEKGGGIWEEYYRVNWNNYIYFEVDEIDINKQEVSMYSTDANLLLNIFPNYKDQIIEKLESWHITYWKKLSNVYVSKLYFNVEDDMELWEHFHEANLPKWREKP